LAQNGFKTEDEIKLEAQIHANRFTTRTTLVGLLIAAIALLVTAIDNVRKWREGETRVVIVNSDDPSKDIPVSVRVVSQTSADVQVDPPTQPELKLTPTPTTFPATATSPTTSTAPDRTP